MKSPTQFTTRNNKHRYRKVALKMWADEKFSSLSTLPPSGQSLWLFLLAFPAQDGIIPGLYRAGRASMAEMLGWEVDQFDACFKEIEAQGMAKADWKSKLVWLPNAARFNPPESPNVVIWWARSWPEIPECDLKAEIYRTLRNHICESGDSYCRAFDEHFSKPAQCKKDVQTTPVKATEIPLVNKACDNPSTNPSDKGRDKVCDNPSDKASSKALSAGKQTENNACHNPSNKGCDNQEQEHIQEQEHNCGDKGGLGERSSAGPSPSAPALQKNALGSGSKNPDEPQGQQGVIEGTDWQSPMDDDDLRDSIRENQTERGTRLPADYTVSAHWLLQARKARPDLPAEQIQTAAENFVGHWSAKPGKDGLKLNWFSAWLNWVRKERAWSPAGQPRSDQSRLLPPSSSVTADETERERKMREFQARYPGAKLHNYPCRAPTTGKT